MKKRILLLLIFIITISLFNNNFTSDVSSKNYLKGKFYTSVKDHFLIATEKMNDNRFSETVIVMFESDENGAWGLVINKRLGTMPIALLIDPSLNSSEEREKLFKIDIPDPNILIIQLIKYITAIPPVAANTPSLKFSVALISPDR